MAVLVDDKVDLAKVATIKSAVMAAAGFNPDRKDQVTVQSIAFDQSTKKAEEQAAAKESQMGMISSIGKTVGAVVLLLGFLMILKKTVKGIKVQLPPPQPQAQSGGPLVPQSVGDMLRETAPTPQPVPEPVAAGVREPASVPAPDGVPNEIAQSSPEELARLVRTWMSEG